MKLELAQSQLAELLRRRDNDADTIAQATARIELAELQIDVMSAEVDRLRAEKEAAEKQAVLPLAEKPPV